MYVSSTINMLFNYPSQWCCKWALKGGKQNSYHLFLNVHEYILWDIRFIINISAEPSLVAVRLKSRFVLALNCIR